MQLNERLRRLGVVRGAGHLKPRPDRKPTRSTGSDIHTWVPGQVIENEQGAFFLVETVFPLDHCHGETQLGSLLEHPPALLARFTGDHALSQLDFSRAAFIDTETTGLAGGTGTYAFLTGVGHFDGDSFRLYQFFMRDYREEPALLHHLNKKLDDLQSIVSFNGKSFDMPLLETRFMLSRLSPDLLDAPHLDLLQPARRLWRNRLPSCALSSLEDNVLHVNRDLRDLPGFLIPQAYFRYLQTGDATEISRVFYHNAQDILSLVTLAWHILAIFQAPFNNQPASGPDMFSLGRLCESLNLLKEGEQAYRHALHDTISPYLRATIEQHLALLYKRTNRWCDAIALWEKLRTSGHSGIVPYIELAKYYEHQVRDCEYALALALQAREQLSASPWQAGFVQTLGEIDHRIHRLKRKLNRQQTDR